MEKKRMDWKGKGEQMMRRLRMVCLVLPFWCAENKRKVGVMSGWERAWWGSDDLKDPCLKQRKIGSEALESAPMIRFRSGRSQQIPGLSAPLA